ncbi:MAG: HPP family protein [Gammaproteobacteria bacterium]|nr:HPP family protein [Gammaproteobacteria bacterium]
MSPIFRFLKKMRGGGPSQKRVPLHEVFWSSLGGFLGIAGIYMLGHAHELRIEDSLFLVGSFGASAVLVYGAPNSPLAQPRNLIGGHVFSALIGVSCSLYIAVPVLAAALAVSLSIAVMHLTKTLHAPGGATALIAVIGGQNIHDLGYWYVLTPITSGAVVMLLVALIVNNLSPHRHYPNHWL